MQTDTTLTWVLIVMVLLMTFLNGTSVSSNPLIQGAALMMQVPFAVAGALGTGSILLAMALVFILLNVYFPLLEGIVGEGILLFVIISSFAIMFAV